jgi:hypothetical protein
MLSPVRSTVLTEHTLNRLSDLTADWQHIREVIPQTTWRSESALRAVRGKKKRAQRPPNPAPACQSLFPRLQDPPPESGVRPYYEAGNPRGALWGLLLLGGGVAVR